MNHRGKIWQVGREERVGKHRACVGGSGGGCSAYVLI